MVIVVRRSDAVLFTSRESSDHENATQLTLRAGLVRRFGSGLYGFTPTGERVRRKLCRHIEREMAAIGGQTIDLPRLQYKPAWERSGRWASFEGEMFTFENREGQQMCLAPSHEESVVGLVDGVVRSYDDLPLLLYQIGKKHRDDHARKGLLRTKEFTMKDAYSLHATRASLEEWYERVRSAYVRIFDALGIEFAVVPADNSVMGGSRSEEFVALAESGTVGLTACASNSCRFGITDESSQFDQHADGSVCPDCGGTLGSSEGIEIGHTFELGARYSSAMDLSVDTPDGSRSVVMGSYGIGVERLIHTLIEQHADDDGCRWSVGDVSVAPYAVSIVPLDYSGRTKTVADRLYEECGERETLLFDDPDRTIGERFAESDLLGIPRKVVIGNHFERTGEVDIETRDGRTRSLEPAAVSERCRRE